MHLFCDDMDTLTPQWKLSRRWTMTAICAPGLKRWRAEVAELKARLDSLLHHLGTKTWGQDCALGWSALGSIAQKAWLPVLGAAESWTLQAALVAG
ncbi:oxidoreductase family, NAD-binding [Klebsiella pneumoniae]|uniref:Oxidoreductase family, NAD-binding n=1 Tax=Klebsiella pneumoniae TaxID=573 RepID=A0A4P0Y5E2_KLEPN|nr:oxidoreductase family, NAD-binding [Klebsiella pneumoniae]